MLAPRGPAKTAALIVTRLTDPQQAENIARTLTPRQVSHVKEALLKGGIAIAHPGCKGKTIIFRPQVVKAIQGR
jgi:1,6-anhydro-N-acetylmuramate kinase